MKKPFLNDDFLLQTETARQLYETFAKPMPIIDFHCHLPPDQIAGDRMFDNLTQIWLYGDHYKWRAMRTNGVDESFCTGDQTDFAKPTKVGRNRSLHRAQSALPLDAPGITALFRHYRNSERSQCPADLRYMHRKTAIA